MFEVISARQASAPTPRSDNLEQRLQSDIEASLDYQILRRTLGIASEAAPPKAPVEKQPKTAADPEQLLETAARDVARFEQVLSQRELQVEIGQPATPQVSDPLVLDLAGNGFSTTGLERGVRFDLNGDGRQTLTSMPSGDDALLAMDRNGNGRIDDGRELFGDQRGAANGFAELARLDDNRDGRLDAQDAAFQQLRLLRFDSQGRQQLQSLEQAGVSAINLRVRDVDIALGAYDRIAQLGSFEFADGRSGQAADLLLAQR